MDLLALLSLGLGGATLVALLFGVRSMGNGPDEVVERLRRHAPARNVAVEDERRPTSGRLVQAGYRRAAAARLFAAAKVVGAVVPPLVFVAYRSDAAADFGLAAAL